MGVVEDEPAVVYAQAITANPVADEHAIPAVAYGGGQAGAPPPFRPRGGGQAAVAAPQHVPQLQQPQFTQEQMTQMQQQQTQMQQVQKQQSTNGNGSTNGNSNTSSKKSSKSKNK